MNRIIINIEISLFLFATYTVFFCERCLELRNIILRNWHLRLLHVKYRNHSDDIREYYQNYFDLPSFQSRTRNGGQFVRYIGSM